MNRRLVFGLAAMAAAAAAVLMVSKPLRELVLGSRAPTDRVVLTGNVEAHESILSFSNVQGTITTLPFDEGRQVRAGTVLATLDGREYEEQLRIDTAALEVARRQLEVARGNLAAQGNTVAADQADLRQKRSDLRIAQGQFAAGAASRQAAEQASTAARVSTAAVARDRALQRVAGDNVALAAANVHAAQAKVALDRLTLSYTVLRAPVSGVLAVREAELGELAGPGVAIFTLDDLDHVWVRAYLNEQDLGRVRLGEPAEVRTDGAPGHVWMGRVGFISPQAEFTPKTVETRAERVTLVYRVRIDVDNPAHDLLPGMPVEVTLDLLRPGR
jgi:HlyD family secretion protein